LESNADETCKRGGGERWELEAGRGKREAGNRKGERESGRVGEWERERERERERRKEGREKKRNDLRRQSW
jgi:hypothetical protein